MAGQQQAKKPLSNLNFVHNDEIWKDHVRHEFLSQRCKWPDKWGYLVDEYNSLTVDLLGPNLKTRPSYMNKTTADLKLPPILHHLKRTTSIPETTSRLIGWKAGNQKCKLEIYGKYPKSRGQNGILNLLKWPQESHP
ncbi:uncharacterized protein C20orf85-like [Mytilus californianus]|uniref:uncharacterized protein C20orf85-like n=1 Tax=Mytilus californianus TaxID=6549 RepID=UPI00224798AC|nr:uncharacterized protein C20orf85-like [Mytilus californianus]